MREPKVAIVGLGVVGSAYWKMFPDAVVYDPLREEREKNDDSIKGYKKFKSATKEEVNACEYALVAVFTPLTDDGELDTSIVEEVINWIESPTILIKSALHPGTVDKLVKKTGKDICVSVELIGEGKYYIPEHKYPSVNQPRKHQYIVIGGETKVAERAAELLWSRMSPDIRIHIVTALEAEIVKLAENTYGAMKVTWANILRDVCDHYGVSFIRVHQGWTEDGRVDPMHTRSVSFTRGWKSKCYDKDAVAMAKIANSKMLDGMLEDNKRHLEMNEK